MNLQFVREILDKDQNIHQYVDINHWPNRRLLFSNFWFIVVPDKSDFVYKYYLSKDFLTEYWISSTESFYFKEKENYDLFIQSNILVPRFELEDIVRVGNYDFYKTNIENVRSYSKKFDNINEISYTDLANILTSIHKLRNWSLIHWNIHPSNFFLDKTWNLWVFDLVGCRKGNKELDISRVYIYSNFDDTYLNNFLSSYKNSIDIIQVYKYTIFDLADNLKYANMSDEFRVRYKNMIKSLTEKIRS